MVRRCEKCVWFPLWAAPWLHCENSCTLLNRKLKLIEVLVFRWSTVDLRSCSAKHSCGAVRSTSHPVTQSTSQQVNMHDSAYYEYYSVTAGEWYRYLIIAHMIHTENQLYEGLLCFAMKLNGSSSPHGLNRLDRSSAKFREAPKPTNSGLDEEEELQDLKGLLMLGFQRLRIQFLRSASTTTS